MKNNWQTKKYGNYINNFVELLKLNNQKIFSILVFSLIILHGLFDSLFKIDNTTVLFVIILILLPYIHLIKKIKFGDFEAEITQKEVNKIEKMADEIPEKKDKEIKTEIVEQLNELVEYDPNLALAKARIEIERKIKMLDSIYLKNKSKSYNLRNLINELVRNKIIDQNLGALLNDVITVANRSIHGDDVSKKNAVKLISIAGKAIQELDYVVIDNVHKDETKEIIDQKKVDDYMEGHYILKTIIPYVKNPEIKTYKLNQIELDAFLEGYDEYAEFMISLEKEKNYEN